MTFDLERIGVEIANYVDMLSLHLRKLEHLSETGTPEQRKRAAKTANTMSARTVGLAKNARRVSAKYPGIF